MVRLTLVEEPSGPPLTATQAKELAGLFGANDDAIEAWIESARLTMDGRNGMLGRALITQVWDLEIGAFPGCPMPDLVPASWQGHQAQQPLRMPLPPLQAVTWIKYRDGDGNVVTLDATLYRVVPGDPGFIVLASGQTWPSCEIAPDAVTIRFTAGYGDQPDDVPMPIRLALAMSITITSSSAARDPLLAREVVDGVGEFAYAAGVQSASMINSEVLRLIGPYRVGGGIS